MNERTHPSRNGNDSARPQNPGTRERNVSQVLDSNALDHTDGEGNPIPVTIPIALCDHVTVVYTTRLGGVSTGDYASCNVGGRGGDDPVSVGANRSALARQLHARISLVSQVHSGIAADADLFSDNAAYGYDFSGGAHGDRGPAPVVKADGQVSARAGVALGMFAADCLPVLLADPQAGVIAAAHCGRKGLQAGILANTIGMMRSKGARTDSIVATLGPRICGDCYEVGSDIADEFDSQFPGTYTLTTYGGPGIDIAQAALQELHRAGVDHIVDSRGRIDAATQYLDHDEELSALCQADGEASPVLGQRVQDMKNSLCTVENPLWYSHRRAALAHKSHEGRLLAFIVRED